MKLLLGNFREPRTYLLAFSKAEIAGSSYLSSNEKDNAGTVTGLQHQPHMERHMIVLAAAARELKSVERTSKS